MFCHSNFEQPSAPYAETVVYVYKGSVMTLFRCGGKCLDFICIIVCIKNYYSSLMFEIFKSNVVDVF